MTEIVLATNNPKKLAELRRVLAEAAPSLTVLGLADVEGYPEPVETERTFEGNALLKARECARHTGKPALADDSGLVVDILNGMPGVRSARWAGPHATDEENLELLLRQMEEVPSQQRGATFVCVMALVLPDGSEHTVRGEMPGQLGVEPIGGNGFGYDPIFIPSGYSTTTGALDPAEKDAISHRGKAVRAMAVKIQELGESGQL